jgi:hypothetical protein
LTNSGLTLSKSGTTGFTVQAPAGKNFTFGHESSQTANGKKELYDNGPTATVTLADA